jgi:catalase
MEKQYIITAGILFRLMDPAQRLELFWNTARSLGAAPREIKLRHIANCLKADPAYGSGVAVALKIPLAESARA